MSTYAIGDIHGCFETLNLLLETINYNIDSDKLILLGDYIDRGIDSIGVLDKIIELQKSGDVIALMGNHEYDALQNNNFIKYHKWIQKLPLIYEDKKFIYVHAGLNPYNEYQNQSKQDLLNIRGKFIKTKNPFHKKIVFGHTPVVEPKIMDNGIIPIDSGCVYSQNGKLTAFNIETEEFISVNNVDDIQNIKEPFSKKIVREIINNNINKKHFIHDIGWWLDTKKIKLYHGTSTENISSILDKGLLCSNTHFSHLSLDMNTAYGFSVFKQGWEESLQKFETNDINNRCLIQLTFDLDLFLEMIVDINFSYGTTYKQLSHKDLYLNFPDDDNEYYKYTEFAFTETINKDYISDVIICEEWINERTKN
jgi:serine/threonine protein phosphatase 1